MKSKNLREDACLSDSQPPFSRTPKNEVAHAAPRYWGLSEVDFILKTMSNAKVHDDLT